MALGVLNNLSAIYAENNLNNTNSSLQTVLQQLSSGSRINSGADDAAGLSLVNGLAANSKALVQSATNSTEGVGLLQVADGALSQVTNLLNRAITLATEASNGTLNTSQGGAANQEYQSILAEINNIGSTTTYNQQAVFGGSTIAIYTGDGSPTGSSINNLYIRPLSASSIGDTNGAMSYTSGQSNVFIDLSSSGNNASATDSLNGGINGSTTITVSYLAKGTNGASSTASANISVGSGTIYANTAQGLINAINDSGLGLTASFGTAASAGSAAVATAGDAADTNNTLLSGGNDTGIIISGSSIGINTPGTDGAGVVGALTVSNSNDLLGGTLTIVGSDSVSHTINLGTPNSTDTLANLAATINSAGYGVTATINALQTQTGQNGVLQPVGTLLTFTSASSDASVTVTNATDASANKSTVAIAGAGATGGAAGTVLGSISANSAADTLTGVLQVGYGDVAIAQTLVNLNLAGMTLAQIRDNFNLSAPGSIGALDNNKIFANLTTNALTGVQTLTFTQNYTTVVPGDESVINGIAKSIIQDSAASTGTPVVQQTNNGVVGNFGKITVTNANDTFTGGTITLNGTNITLGTSVGANTSKTDTLANLAAYINGNAALAGSNITAALSSDGTVLTLNGTTAANNFVYGAGVTTSLALTNTPTAPGSANSTILGTLSLPTTSTSGADMLKGTLTFGTETITLGTQTGNAKTDTMSNLAQTINQGSYGVKAILNSNNTAITFTSDDSANATAANVVPAAGVIALAWDNTPGGGNIAANELVFSRGNNNVTSSAYYSIGLSGSVNDTSTNGGTSVIGYSSDQDGSGGIATMGYTDGPGANLSATDLSTQKGSQAALTALNLAIADVAAMDGYLGAMINTLNSVSQVLNTQQQNVVAAQNAIQATDYAAATSNMSKYEILSQTGIAALAQANQVQQEVTKLLQ